MITPDNALLILIIPAVVCIFGPIVAMAAYRKQMNR